MKVFQYIVTLINSKGMFEYKVNCANEDSAKNIAYGIYGNVARIINIRKA